MNADTGVTLRAYGYDTDDSVIVLCPDHNYTIAFNCTVTESSSLQWSLEPLLDDPVSFTVSDDLCDPIYRPSVTVFITKREVTESGSFKYESQLMVSTPNLRDAITSYGSQIDVQCQASSTRQGNIMTIINSGNILILRHCANKKCNIYPWNVRI